MGVKLRTIRVMFWAAAFHVVKFLVWSQLLGLIAIVANVALLYYNIEKSYHRLFFGPHTDLGSLNAILIPSAGLGVLLFIFFIDRAWPSVNTIYTNIAMLINAFGIIVFMIIQYAEAYSAAGLLDMDHKLTHEPASCLYFSAVTWTTVGYGDFVPSESARIIAASEGFVSYFAFALFLAFATRVVGAPFRQN
jgi:Ion channel